MKILTLKCLAQKFFFIAALFWGLAGFVCPVAVQAASFSLQAGTSTSGSAQTAKTPPVRQDRFMGTGNSSTGGFSTTYTDPQTGDIITRVIPPAPQDTQQTPVPIYIYPQVEPQWPPKNNAQPQPVPVPRVPEPYAPKPPSNPSLYNSYGQ